MRFSCIVTLTSEENLKPRRAKTEKKKYRYIYIEKKITSKRKKKE